MEEKLEALKKDAEDKLEKVSTLEELKGVRVFLFGKEGSITILLRSIKNISVANRGYAGKMAKDLKKFLSEAIEERRKEILKDK